MKHIVILGSSAAGIKVIEEIRNTDSSSEITIISLDGHYPYRRDAFAPFIAKEIAAENVFCRSKDFYDQRKVKIILDKKISRINIKRKKIFTDDKVQIDYDVLIVTDTPENRFPDIKGTNKDGVFGYKKLKDIDQMTNTLSLVKTVAVQSNSFSGLQAAAAFTKREKEVILVASAQDFLARNFEGDMLEWLLSQFEGNGLRIIRDNRISEILGERDAKAIRLETGKVFSAEIILFCELEEDLRLLAGSEVQMDKKINVDPQFKTNGEGVFAVDQTCHLSDFEPVTALSVLEEQGEVVAAAINGQERFFKMPIYSRDLNINGLTITVLGQTGIADGVSVDKTFDRESGKYKALYIKDSCLMGAVLVNTDDEKGPLLKLISEKAEFQGVQETVEKTEFQDSICDIEALDKENVSTELVDN